MWVTVGNLYSKVTRATDEESSWLSDYLSFDNPSSRFRRSGPDRIRMFNILNQTFPSGFVSMVKKSGTAEGFQVQVVDGRAPPVKPDPQADISWLYDFQREAVERAVARKHGILWLPTGAGKTEIAVALSQALPCTWLFLVPDKTLLGQTAARFEKRVPGMRAGRIGEGMWEEGDGTFIVATFQTLSSRLKAGDKRARSLLERCQGVIVDECHVLPADSFWKVAMSTVGAYYRFGLSGTPLARGDRRSVLALAALGPVIHRVRPELLIDRGLLARPTVRLCTVVQASTKPTWQGVYGECVVRSSSRNKKLTKLAQRATKPCLMFVKEVSHGKQITEQLLRNGLRADFTYGDHSTEWRNSMVGRLVRGDLDVLVCSVIFQQGVDIPCLRSVIIGSGGKSVIASLQRIGRGMRIERDHAGNVIKNAFEVFDVYDKGNKWLEKHTKARLAAYAGEGYETIVEPPTL